MNKSAEAFRTISEVAEELDVPKHVLRFWEGKFPQIRPMKRGGGRRYYRPEDMELLRGIRHLLHAEGYTIKGVQKILREQGIDQVKTLVRETMANASRVPAKKASPRNSKVDGSAALATRPQAQAAAKATVVSIAAASSRSAMNLCTPSSKNWSNAAPCWRVRCRLRWCPRSNVLARAGRA